MEKRNDGDRNDLRVRKMGDTASFPAKHLENQSPRQSEHSWVKRRPTLAQGRRVNSRPEACLENRACPRTQCPLWGPQHNSSTPALQRRGGQRGAPQGAQHKFGWKKRADYLEPESPGRQWAEVEVGLLNPLANRYGAPVVSSPCGSPRDSISHVS